MRTVTAIVLGGVALILCVVAFNLSETTVLAPLPSGGALYCGTPWSPWPGSADRLSCADALRDELATIRILIGCAIVAGFAAMAAWFGGRERVK